MVTAIYVLGLLSNYHVRQGLVPQCVPFLFEKDNLRSVGSWNWVLLTDCFSFFIFSSNGAWEKKAGIPPQAGGVSNSVLEAEKS